MQIDVVVLGEGTAVSLGERNTTLKGSALAH